MEKSNLRTKILNEIENLVAGSTKYNSRPKYESLHVAILKNHYNAALVSIDYHRKRVKLDIVLDDKAYDPKKVNTNVPILYANLLFKNLGEFLKSCIDNDSKSLAIYVNLLKSFKDKGAKYSIA
ncbi:hypothetical protein JQC67_05010 [Aurantibacter crassamenti]|uniref:hypothetical protein n=1 Tax=Aurantibacter crassamenti TaxID=1837375 RepID=UPI0019392D85|nr:hypothetical protein [Aurantibacter crassamenti]MBM1105496.1 hypothetical protein [Aurantibacter crassamenti]